MKTFKQFIDLLEVIADDQAIESQKIATHIYKHIKRAADEMMAARKRGEQASLLPIIRKYWQSVDGKDNVFLVDQQKFQTQFPVKVMITTNGGKTGFMWMRPQNGQKIGLVAVDAKDIENAKDMKTMSWALQATLGKILHEPVHYHNQPDTAMMSDYPDTHKVRGNADSGRAVMQAAAKAVDPAEQARLKNVALTHNMLYMAEDKEVEAYGHQFAMLYHRQYPFDRYDLGKMMKLIEKIRKLGQGKADVNQNSIHFFITMRQPNWQNFKHQGKQPFAHATQYMDTVMTHAVDSLLRRGNQNDSRGLQTNTAPSVPGAAPNR